MSTSIGRIEKGAHQEANDSAVSPYVENARRVKKGAVLAGLHDYADDDNKLKKKKQKSNAMEADETILESKVHELGKKTSSREKKAEEKPSSASDAVPAIAVPSKASKPEAGRKKRKEKGSVTFDGPASASEMSAIHDGKESTKTKNGGKRKHAGAMFDGDTIVDSITDESQRVKKKKHKTSNILNPEEDKVLSGQAFRALEYAYLQYRRPEEWKFNKAKQNWLIRNVWSSDLIPEGHLPLVLWYLKSVKGGVRDTLRKTCQTHLQPPEESQIADESTQAEPAPLFGLPLKAVAKPVDNALDTKRQRALILLEALDAV